jgi:hypothetical protein
MSLHTSCYGYLLSDFYHMLIDIVGMNETCSVSNRYAVLLCSIKTAPLRNRLYV